MILRLNEIDGHPVGGKAKGLGILNDLGFRVPEAVVFLHPAPEEIGDHILEQHLTLLGPGPKAVRSSAVSEDGLNASFAGQFESYLNLGTLGDVRKAITDCIEAAGSSRVQIYSDRILTGADLRISVILQNMVDAAVAGVLFSANPVSNRRDKVIVNAVRGIGEDLVSGKKDACHYEIFRSGAGIDAEVARNGNLISTFQLRELLDGAKKAEKYFGSPVDMEWAIDQSGKINWLQVRPITTLDDVHFNELDTVKGESADIWTLGNIGEMMPGVATPLTYTVSAEAIDYGMVLLAQRGGAFRLKDRNGPRYIQMFYNRLFINMSNMMDYPKRIWMNKPEDVQYALSGKAFPGLEAKPEGNSLVRIYNFFRQISTTMRATTYLKKLQKLEAGFRIKTDQSADELYESLDKSIVPLGIGFGHHLMTSAQSGTMYSAFMRIMTGDERIPTADDHHIATLLLLNIPGIESADAVKSLEKLASIIRNDKEFARQFTSAGAENALLMLENAPENIRGYFKLFLERHGHRCVRESELRETTWGNKPVRLIQILQSGVKAGEVRHPEHDLRKIKREALSHLPFIKRFVLGSLIATARKAVARREITKALSIKMVDTMRKGYHALAEKLLSDGLLDDIDQIYFLTHQEIGTLLKTSDKSLLSLANKRRVQLPLTDQLIFEEVSFGIPEPIEQESLPELTEGQLSGIPVSSGICEARVRIINSLDDAEQLKEGEIMVASFTDIGWTPYFSIISGLITEIGSPLSHGAVVAREYGIPAVVAVKGAKKILHTGDLVRLDGNKGIIETLQLL